MLSRSNVLVSGLNGLGVEIAKNLALAGVKSVTLHDEETVGCWDLSSNFFSEDGSGKNRAEACVQKLQELNSAVLIYALTEKLSKEQLSDFQVVVFTDLCLEKAIEFNDYCHNHKPPIPFIKSEVRGLFGNVFCDFGPGFTVFDVDDEEPRTGIIVFISNDNPALVSCVDDERLEFQDGDLVVFSEVKGMTELNDGKPRKVINAGPYSFFLEEDSTHFCAYDRGGIVMQVKQPKIQKFKTLRDSLKDPGDFILTDLSKYDRPPLLHLAFQALDKFRHDFGRFPVAESEEDVQRLIGFAVSINETSGDCKVKEVDEKLLRYFTTGSREVLSPMAAMFGVIVGQEVVKACLGKSHPIVQFFYFDSIECLPVELQKPEDLKPLNPCHDAQISVFGSNIQKKLEQAIGFMAGAGALGCEFLKNFALMGVCCSRNGKFTTTDDDAIAESMLSRQFLFRDWNIGQSNSTVAATAASTISPALHVEAHQNHVCPVPEDVFASTISPALHVEAHQNRVCPVPEDVFNDAFYERRDSVVNALDNVNARLYADMRCVYFQKLLLESGTVGTKCNTQMVIPHLTENHSVSRDPPEKQAPMCTVHSFPHNIDHWPTRAHSEFDGLIYKTPNEVNNFLSNPKEYASPMKNASDAQARDELEHALECLDKERCKTFEDCVTWARLKFEDHFSNHVKQLIYTFPDDAATSTGAPFWSAPKRFPQPLEFSASDPAHLHFVMDVSILRAQTFGITVPDWAKSPKKLADAVSQVMVPDFEPKKDVNIVTDEKAISMSTASTDDATAINDLLPSRKSLQKKLPPGYRMNPIQFEKIYGAANISSGTTILAFICGRGDVGIIAAETRVSSGNPALGTFTCSDDCFCKINSIVHGRIYAAFSGTVKDCKAVIEKLQDSVVRWTQDLHIDVKDIEVQRVVLEAKNIIRSAERRSSVHLLILGWDQPCGIRVYSVNSAGEHRRDLILTFGSGASSIAVQSWKIDFTEDEAYDWVRKAMNEAMYFDPNSGGKVCCATIFPHGKSKEQIDWNVVAELDGTMQI